MSTLRQFLFVSFFTSPLLLFLLSLPTTADAKLVELSWNVSYVSNVNPDGLHPRRAIGINGVWPIPPVRVSQDDQLVIHLHNGLGDVGTAIHSHGLFFNGSAYYDGAVAVTQWYVP